MTGAAVIVVWAIIGGPMRGMKPRYKAFMFFVAISLAGATIDKVNFLAGGDYHTHIIAKLIIATARMGMVVSGLYVLLMWHRQCRRILEVAGRRPPMRAGAAFPSSHVMSDSHSHHPHTPVGV